MKKRALVVWTSVIVAITLLAGCGAVPQGTNITVSNIGNVEGTVTDASTGAAVSGVTVQVGDKSDVTGSNGVYSIQELAVGSRTATATKTGYQDYNGTMTVTEGMTVIHNIQMTLAGAGDTTPPTVSSTDPAINATGVAVNKVIAVTFSEAMDCSTVTISSFTLKDNLNTVVIGTINTCNNTTATFTPSSNLASLTLYTATISTGVKDSAGNAMASDYTWSFTTGTAPDTTAPTVSSTSPANSATSVAVNSAITATFSETMDASTITTTTFTIASVTGAVTYSGTTATFTPSSSLSYSTTYTATITTGVKDSAGNAMASDYTWTFTTGTAPDTTAPTVSSTSPANNATSVAVNSAITATFSETMDASTITTTTFTIASVTGAVTYSGTTATFTPSSSLSYSTTYTATITTGVKDSAGNAIAGNYTWTFTTGTAPDTTAPTITSVSPVNNATTVTVNSAITATFSETMDASTITTTTFTIASVTGAVTYSGTTATFTPSSSLSYSTTYTATITTGVKDSAGNATASNYTWQFTTVATWSHEAYLKAPNAGANDWFGYSVAVNADTVVVGAYNEDNGQTTITNGTTVGTDSSTLTNPGAVYVFKRSGTTWAHEAYLKAPNAGSSGHFGYSVAVDADTVVVGAKGESSNQTTITNGTTASGNVSVINSGAVYVFKRSGATWVQEAYLKAPNAEANDNFGNSVAVNADTVVVGAYGEDSNQMTITNGTTASADNTAANSGAVYVFKRSGTTWTQEAYLKAPNAEANDWFSYNSVAVNADTVVVGAPYEDNGQTTITNGTIVGADSSTATNSGAVYVFKRSGATWTHEAYLKAPNAETVDYFGNSVAVNADTVVVGAQQEDSNQTTITNGTTASADNSASASGAVYVFKRSGTAWSQEAYLKAPNAEASDNFGWSVAVNADTVVVGAPYEDSSQTTITNGTTASTNNSASSSGAAYVFKRSGTTWLQEAYLKAPNAEANDYFGASVAVNVDTVVVGAYYENNGQTTITNGTTVGADSSTASASGAVYVFKR